jgi:hypothetical protein
MNFILKALQYDEFAGLFELPDTALEKIGAKRMIVDEFPGFPCRVSLQDAEPGEEVILLPYQHHKTNSPYQASGPIFVRKGVTTANLQVNEKPKMFEHRLLSLRAYDKNGIMKNAAVVEGKHLRESVLQVFADGEINYIHIHNARPGCYNCTVERVG